MEFYEEQNGNYHKLDEHVLGSFTNEVYADPDWLYFIVSTFDPSI